MLPLPRSHHALCFLDCVGQGDPATTTSLNPPEDVTEFQSQSLHFLIISTSEGLSRKTAEPEVHPPPPPQSSADTHKSMAPRQPTHIRVLPLWGHQNCWWEDIKLPEHRRMLSAHFHHLTAMSNCWCFHRCNTPSWMKQKQNRVPRDTKKKN